MNYQETSERETDTVTVRLPRLAGSHEPVTAVYNIERLLI